MKRIFYQTQLARFGRKTVAAVTATTMFAAMLVAPASVMAANDDAAALTSIAPGTVISSSNYSLPAGWNSLATAKRIKYVSTDSNGQRIPVTGVVFKPKHDSTGETVAWAHGTTGIADACAPSTNIDVFYPEAFDAIKGYLQKGWTVTATDYAGLGTRGVHPYLVGDSEGRAVIDSVRAARNLDTSLTRRWTVSGHSQGGQAALFAGEIADTYGQGLNLKGVAALAPASNLDILATGIPGMPGNGYLVLALYGLAAVDSTVHPEALLAQPARDIVHAGALEQCGDIPILTSFGSLTAEELLVGGQLPESVLAKFAISNPGQQVSVAPIFIGQGKVDEVIPFEITELLHYNQICAVGSQSFLKEYDGQDHVGVVFASENNVEQFFNRVFNNLSVPSNC